MADQDTDTSEVEQEEAPPRPPSKLKARLLVFGFMTSVVVLECVGVYIFLPSAAELESIASAQEKGILEPGGPEDLLQIEDDGEAKKEVDLGQFSLTSFQPETNTTLRIDFHLFGTVLEDDVDDFDEARQIHHNRMREQVIVIVRRAVITDLTDPSLALIKRRILEKSNRVLGKPLLQGMIVSDFSFIEQ